MTSEYVIQLINESFQANAHKQFAHAAKIAEKACELAPNRPEAWYNLGVAQKGQGKAKLALRALKKAADLSQKAPAALSDIGLALNGLGATTDARKCFETALRQDPNHLATLVNFGKLQAHECQFSAAEALFRKAIECQPELFVALINLGGTLNAQKRFREALTACEKAMAIATNSAEAYTTLGTALSGLGRLEEAEAACRRALQIDPNMAKAWSNLANVLHFLHRNNEAVEAGLLSVQLAPDSADELTTLGGLLLRLKQFSAAKQYLQQALRLNPNCIDAHINLAEVYSELKAHPEAIRHFETVQALDPERDFLLGTIQHNRMKICDWQGFAGNLERLERLTLSGKRPSPPFDILALSTHLEVHRRCAESWSAIVHPESDRLGVIPTRPHRPDKKIRIAYFSADFHNHPTAYLIAELFELHDKASFEVLAFSFGPNTQDEMRKRLEPAFDEFIDVRSLTDIDIAKLAREKDIDIAIDLKGYTAEGRGSIFAYRVAPIQVSYLGFPGTLGAPYMDYIIADPVLIPETAMQFYSEKVIFLPDSYQVNDTRRPISDNTYSRQAVGLPEAAFVFCCFNNNYKITPMVFDSWMRIMRRVDGSVLWLFESTSQSAANLRREAEARGVSPSRLHFAHALPLADHLARHELADLFLDTWPYNAHTTTSDALWTGLPVLTCSGRSFASRVAASLLTAAGLPELITETAADFEDLAVALANDPERLAALRTKLRLNRDSCALFDTSRFTRNLEAAYRSIHACQLAGQPRDHLYVNA